MSVVDYFVVPYEQLDMYYDFPVIRPTEIYNVINGIEPRIIPDHSILSCYYKINNLEKDVILLLIEMQLIHLF